MATDWGKILASKFVKWIAAILLIMLVVVIGVGLFSNKPINLWGLSFNQEKTKYVHDTVESVIRDTIKLAPVIPSSPSKTNKSNKNHQGIDQKTDSGNNEANQNFGTNNGNVGGKDNTVYNLGIIPRQITQNDLQEVIDKLPNKEVQIVFYSYGSPDAEIIAVKTQIAAIMRKNGFNKIGDRFINMFVDKIPSTIVSNYDTRDNVLEFHIPPAQQ